MAGGEAGELGQGHQDAHEEVLAHPHPHEDPEGVHLGEPGQGEAALGPGKLGRRRVGGGGGGGAPLPPGLLRPCAGMVPPPASLSPGAGRQVREGEEHPAEPPEAQEGGQSPQS